MSCWVVPTVAADFWGVTLDVVWRRICDGLVPHKTEEGFVFIDVDPWTADSDGNLLHQPPSTFVAASDAISLEESILTSAFAPDDIVPAQWLESQPSDAGIELLEAKFLTADSWDIASIEQLTRDDESEPVFASIAEDEADFEHVNDDSDAHSELPDLDEEETATFGRLSWVEVRSQVSRIRRPPPSFAS